MLLHSKHEAEDRPDEEKEGTGQDIHLKSPLAQQTDLQAAEEQQAPLHHVLVFLCREMKDDRKSLMYCTIQLKLSSHKP